MRRAVVTMTNQAAGIDVSHYKKRINWRQVKHSGVQFAFLKATEADNFIDSRFDYNWTYTRREGIIRGAYHFFRPLVDPAAQARHFVRIAGQTLHATDLPPVVDIEQYPDFVLKEWKQINLEERIRRVRVWLEHVEQATGRTPIIYTDYYTWYELFKSTEEFIRYPLWIAHWRVNAPKVPARNWGGQGWLFWQTTDRGVVPGIRDSAPCVDMNVFTGSYQDLARWLKFEGPRPAAPAVTNGDFMSALIDTADNLGLNAENLVQTCGLDYLVEPIGNSLRPYDGPALSELPVSEEVRKALADQVGRLEGRNSVVWHITHQDLINAFYYAATLEEIGGWTLVERAGLDYIGEDRGAMYDGPVIADLPGLTDGQKDAIMAALGIMEPPSGDNPSMETGEVSGSNSEPQSEEIVQGEVPELPEATYGPEVDNQAVINAFYLTAIRLERSGREMMTRADLADLVDQRLEVYVGPRVEDLPGLISDERQSIAELMGIDLGDIKVDEVVDPDAWSGNLSEEAWDQVPEVPNESAEPPAITVDEFIRQNGRQASGGPTYPGLVNQDIINIFFRAAAANGGAGQDWLVRSGLQIVGESRQVRYQMYRGPVFEALPGLSAEEREALQAELASLTV